jgi:hypothetical protein
MIQGGAGGLNKTQILSLIYGNIGNDSITTDGAGLKLDLAINNNEVT